MSEKSKKIEQWIIHMSPVSLPDQTHRLRTEGDQPIALKEKGFILIRVMDDQSVIVREPISINLWQAISDIMSKHIQELSQAEASSASDSESDNGVSIPGAENSDFFSDEDESLISSTDGKKNISTISDHKGIEKNLSIEFLQSELKKSRNEIDELREVTEKQRFNFLVAMALEETSIGPGMLVNGSNLNFSQKSSLSQVILNLMKGDQLVWHSHFVLTSKVYSWEPIRTSSQFGRHIRMILIIK
jgi:hypothetical protein